MHKKHKYSNFYNGKSHHVFRFSVKPANIREKGVKMNICINFRIKVTKKWHASKPNRWNSTDRKMKIIIRRVFPSIIMHPIFMHFCLKINFKSAFESFAFVSEHLRTNSLDWLSMCHSSKKFSPAVIFTTGIKNFQIIKIWNMLDINQLR